MMDIRKVSTVLSIVLLWTVLIPGMSDAAGDEDQMIGDVLEQRTDGESGSSTEETNTWEQEDSPASDNGNATTGDEQPKMKEDTSIVSMLLQLVLALAAVIAIMYFLLKFINKRTQSFQSQKTMQNLGGVPLGQNRSVQMIKIGERLLIVGVGDSIRLLKEIDEETEIEDLLEKDNHPDNKWTQKGFSIFQALFKNKKTDEAKPDSFQKVLEGQLGEMKDTRKKARRHLKGYDQ